MKIKLLIATMLLGFSVLASAAVTNFPNGVSSFGVVLPTGESFYPGNHFYVGNSVAGYSDSNPGTKEKPFATLDYAIGKCSADKGDVIYVLPGHTETVDAASDITFDVAGVTVVFLGNSDVQGTITAGATAGTTNVSIVISADDVRIKGGKFLVGLDGILTVFDIDASGTILDGLVCDEGTSKQAVHYIDLGTGSNQQVYNCVLRSIAAGANEAIIISATANADLRIIGNTIQGDFANAGIYSAKAFRDAVIQNNIVRNDQAGDHAIELTTTCNGMLVDNNLYSNAFATSLDPGSMYCIGNRFVSAIDGSDTVVPAKVDTTDNYVGTNSADNSATTALVAANRDGSLVERTEFLMGNSVGSEFAVTCSVTSSAIPSNSQTAGAITSVASGDLILMDILVGTDGTGWAAPTNIEFTTDSAYGLTGAAKPIVLEGIGTFGANLNFVATVDGDTKKLPCRVENGKKVFIHGDDAAGTGGGKGVITMIFKRITANATITGASL